MGKDGGDEGTSLSEKAREGKKFSSIITSYSSLLRPFSVNLENEKNPASKSDSNFAVIYF